MSDGPGKLQFATIIATDSKKRLGNHYKSKYNLRIFQAENAGQFQEQPASSQFYWF